MGTLRFVLSGCELQEIKMAPSEFCRFGEFSYRFTKEASDFYTSVGFPKNISDKMVGTKMWFKNIGMSKGKDGKEGKPRVCPPSHYPAPAHYAPPAAGYKTLSLDLISQVVEIIKEMAPIVKRAIPIVQAVLDAMGDDEYEA